MLLRRMPSTSEAAVGCPSVVVLKDFANSVRMGRHRTCEVRCPSMMVSKYHAKVTFQDGVCTFTDLGAANGCYLNLQRVDNFAVMRDGDMLSLGYPHFRGLGEDRRVNPFTFIYLERDDRPIFPSPSLLGLATAPGSSPHHPLLRGARSEGVPNWRERHAGVLPAAEPSIVALTGHEGRSGQEGRGGLWLWGRASAGRHLAPASRSARTHQAASSLLANIVEVNAGLAMPFMREAPDFAAAGAASAEAAGEAATDRRHTGRAQEEQVLRDATRDATSLQVAGCEQRLSESGTEALNMPSADDGVHVGVKRRREGQDGLLDTCRQGEAQGLQTADESSQSAWEYKTTSGFPGSDLAMSGGKEGVNLESEMQCPVCVDVLLAAHSLPCSHTFCGDCLNMWLERKRECPSCRAAVRHSPHPVRLLDHLVEQSAKFTADEVQARAERLAAFQKRKKEKSAEAAQMLAAWKLQSGAGGVLMQARLSLRAINASQSGHGGAVRRQSLGPAVLPGLLGPMPPAPSGLMHRTASSEFMQSAAGRFM